MFSKKFVIYRSSTISLTLSESILSPTLTEEKTFIVSFDILSLPFIVIFLTTSAYDKFKNRKKDKIIKRICFSFIFFILFIKVTNNF